MQLDKLPEFTRRRRENFAYLYNGLKDMVCFQLFEKYPESEPAWFGFLLTVKDGAHFTRNELTKYLESNKIQTRNLFSGNLLKHPCFEGLAEGKDYRVAGELRNTDKIMNDSFWIGVFPGMSKAKLDYMIEKIKEGVKQ